MGYAGMAGQPDMYGRPQNVEVPSMGPAGVYPGQPAPYEYPAQAAAQAPFGPGQMQPPYGTAGQPAPAAPQQQYAAQQPQAGQGFVPTPLDPEWQADDSLTDTGSWRALTEGTPFAGTPPWGVPKVTVEEAAAAGASGGRAEPQVPQVDVPYWNSAPQGRHANRSPWGGR
jgi:hypothetical protein